MVHELERSPGSPLRRLGGALLTLLVLAALALAMAVAVVPAVSGASTLTVLSQSMEPTLHVGSVVVVRPEAPEHIAVGDVMTFTARDPATGGARTVTHRVIEVLPGPEFRTRGDNNADADQSVVAAADVQGTEWYTIPYAGSIAESLRTPAGLVVAGGVLLLLIGALLLVPGGRTEPREQRR